MYWFLEPFRKYADFSGRARRMEYWMFYLGVSVIGMVLLILSGASDAITILVGLFYLGILIPGLAVGVRRMHDTGRSGWWILISVIPFVGWIWFLVLAVLDSEPGENQYGPNPKRVAALVASPQSAQASSPSSAEETVRQRYARGEIDEATLNRMLDQIRHSWPASSRVNLLNELTEIRA